MNSAEMQTMLAAIRAVAATVEELSAVVEAVPAKVSRQLREATEANALAVEACTTAAAAQIEAMAGQIDAVRASLAEGLAAASVQGQAHADALEKMQGIIDNNQADFQAREKALRDSLTAGDERMTQYIDSTGMRIKQVDDLLQATKDELFNLHATVAKSDGRVEALAVDMDKTFGELRARDSETVHALGSMTEATMKSLQEVGELVASHEERNIQRKVELGARLEEVRSTLVEATTEVLDKHGEEINARIDAVITEQRGAAETLAQQHVASTQAINEGIDTRLTEQAKAIELVKQQLQSEVNSVQSAAVELCDGMLSKAMEFTTQKAEELAAEIGQGVNVRFDALGATLEGKVDVARHTELQEQVNLTANAVKSIEALSAESVVKMSEAIETARTEAAAAIDTAMGTARTEAAEAVDAVKENVATLQVSLSAEIEGVHRLANEASENVLRQVGEMSGAIETQFKEVADALETFNKSVGVSLEVTNKNIAATEGSVQELEQKLAQVSEKADRPIPKFDESALLEQVDERFKALPPSGATAEQMDALQQFVREAVPSMSIEPTFDGHQLELVARVAGEETGRVSIPFRNSLRYRGVFDKNEKYLPSDFVTHKGSMWTCTGSQTGAPGTDVTGWKLAVKSGRDGRDGHSVQSYTEHNTGTTYMSGDFLRHNQRLWQCCVAETLRVPEGAVAESTPEWTLIGGVQ